MDHDKDKVFGNAIPGPSRKNTSTSSSSASSSSDSESDSSHSRKGKSRHWCSKRKISINFNNSYSNSV